MTTRKKTILALAFIPIVLLVKFLGSFPNFIETYYSNGLYIALSKLERYAFGWLPFSFGDIVYILGIILIVKWLFVNRKRLIKDTKNWFTDVFAALTIIYTSFHLFWGMNYYRLPLHEALNIDEDYTTEELHELINKLTAKTDTLQKQLAENDSAKVIMPFLKKDILKQAPEAYKVLSKDFPDFDYHPSSVKKSLLSLPLTYMGFSGYLNPFTNEAQVDYLIPAYKLPTTTCHEIAHQIGYAAENEANFIGSLAAIKHPNKYFNYSGYAFALRHCLNELYRRDENLYKKAIKTVNKGLLNNYREVRDFWDSYKNPTEPLFKATYSAYLQSNNQDKGIESYSYVVALLVNYYQQNQL